MNADAKVFVPIEAALPPELPSSAETVSPEADLVRVLAEWLNQREDSPQGLATRTIQFCFDRSD